MAWTWVWVGSGSWVMDREACGAAVHGVTKNCMQLSSWTELNRMGGCKPLGSLNSFFSYAPLVSGPILFPFSPCFLPSPSSSAINMGRGSVTWISVLWALIHIWRPEIADGRDISCLLIWQKIFSFPRLSPGLLHCRQILHHLSHQGSPGFCYTFYLLVFFPAQFSCYSITLHLWPKLTERKMSNLLAQ